MSRKARRRNAARLGVRAPIVPAILLALVAGGCHSSPAPGVPVTKKPRYQNATWGLCAIDLRTGQTLIERDADRLLAPASTAKLFSVAAAFEGLGTDFRFETTVHQHGRLGVGGRLHGALILRASGDFTLGGRDPGDGSVATTASDHIYARANPRTEWAPPSPVQGLDHLARQVFTAGVRAVDDAWIDPRAFPPFPSSGSGPTQVWPISINDNLVDFEIRATAPGEPATVRPHPASDHYRITSRILTTRSGVYAVDIRSPSPGHFVLDGTIPARHPTRRESLPVVDPPAFARVLWIEALARNGVRVDGPRRWRNPTELLPPQGVTSLPVLARLFSAPFAEQAKLILKVSHNLHASALPVLLALRQGSRSPRVGMAALARQLRALGAAPETISLAGGAGGHEADRTSARSTVQLLRAVAARPWFSAFRSALPILGVDGTLAHIGTGSKGRGRIAAKTGSLYTYDALNARRVLTAKSLAGYLTAESGRPVAFAILVNNVLLEAETGLDAVSEDLAAIATEILERF